MAKRKENPSKEIKQGEEEKEKEEEAEAEAEAEEEKSFEELGLDLRLVHALNKKGIQKPTPIQQVAIPLILVSLFNFSSDLFSFWPFDVANSIRFD